MNLYLLSQDVNNDYDTYDSIIVAAENEDEARLITPSRWKDKYTTWAMTPDQVQVKLIGQAVTGTLSGIVLASFNAG